LQALAQARAAHAGPRAELAASLLDVHREWRSAVAQKSAQLVESWEQLRLERKPADEEVAPLKAKKTETRKVK
jgi:hypothetical protein